MRQLKRNEDPTGFLNLFRYESAMRFGDPEGKIQGHGRYAHHTKRGPGRRHADGVPQGENLKLSAFTRNPVIVQEVQRIYPEVPRYKITQGPVRMKLPRLRRCSR